MKITAQDAKSKFDEILQRAAAGERITLTQEGVPIADLVPHQTSENGEGDVSAPSLLESMREFRKHHGANLTIEEILAFRDEGRR